MAWQILPKTVLRVGWGVSYARTANEGDNVAYSAGFGFNTLNYASPGTGQAAFLTQERHSVQALGPARQYADPGASSAEPQSRAGISRHPIHRSQCGTSSAHPAIQRDAAARIDRDLVVQGAYVGNRAVWLENDSLVDYNMLTPQRLAAFGLNLNNSADRSLLTSQIGSATAKARGFVAPYVGFPSTSTLPSRCGRFRNSGRSAVSGRRSEILITIPCRSA